MRPHDLLLPALLLTTTTAPAQVDPTWTPMNEITWGGTVLGSGKTVTRMLAGEVWPDQRTDVVALGGHNNRDLLFLSGPATNEGVLRLAESKVVRDFDLTPPDASGVQQIVYVDSNGLNRLRTEYDTGLVSYEFVDEVLFTTDGWPTGQRVRTGRLDSGTTTDYVGLGLNLKTILILIDGTTASSFLPGPRVYEILVGDYTGDSNQEIALLLQTGVAVYDASGTQLWFQSEAYADGSCLARMPGAASGKDALAWLTRVDDDTTLRLIALPGGVITAATRTFVDSEFTALTAGDADGDDLQDLLIAQVRASAPVLILNTGSTSAPAFAVGDGPLEPLANLEIDDPIDNVAAPVFADLTQDGSLDIVIPACTTTTATFHTFARTPYGVAFEEWPGEAPYPQPPTAGRHLGVSGQCGQPGMLVSSAYLGEFGWYRVAPPSIPSTHSLFLEVRVWRRHVDFVNYAAYTQPQCVARTAHLVTGEPDSNEMYRVLDLDFSPLLGLDDQQVSQPELQIVWADARWISCPTPVSPETWPAIGQPISGATNAGPTSTVVLYYCGNVMCDVLPTPFDTQTHFALEAELQFSPAPCPNLPSNSCGDASQLTTECGLNGVYSTNAVSLNRRPGPPPGVPASSPAQPVRGQNLVPFD